MFGSMRPSKRWFEHEAKGHCWILPLHTLSLRDSLNFSTKSWCGTNSPSQHEPRRRHHLQFLLGLLGHGSKVLQQPLLSRPGFGVVTSQVRLRSSETAPHLVWLSTNTERLPSAPVQNSRLPTMMPGRCTLLSTAYSRLPLAGAAITAKTRMASGHD
jgi:hypothetical protein